MMKPTNMFTPINRHIEIEPLQGDHIIQTQETSFEEKGIVKSLAEDCTIKVSIGDTVFFDSWLCARFTCNDGSVRYLVEESSIRAYEHV